jgi:hypothetical protein
MRKSVVLGNNLAFSFLCLRSNVNAEQNAYSTAIARVYARGSVTLQ